jgi:hypothetical protein
MNYSARLLTRIRNLAERSHQQRLIIPAIRFAIHAILFVVCNNIPPFGAGTGINREYITMTVACCTPPG